ncbi:unnamed protein product [Protopolystoma xenopodis]|uniref:Uncharacterized protein n=1 Tax=Protopolystoma xenopodis TaxID=117903 RepID=A0A448WAV4_9PLAT|nr:unnamed protein product [Protopolystoma xenopodis]
MQTDYSPPLYVYLCRFLLIFASRLKVPLFSRLWLMDPALNVPKNPGRNNEFETMVKSSLQLSQACQSWKDANPQQASKGQRDPLHMRYSCLRHVSPETWVKHTPEAWLSLPYMLANSLPRPDEVQVNSLRLRE